MPTYSDDDFEDEVEYTLEEGCVEPADQGGDIVRGPPGPTGPQGPAGPPGTSCPLYCGTGSPEGVVTSVIGGIYEQTDAASDNHSIWIKRTGTGNTGWHAWNGLRGRAGADDSIAIGDGATSPGPTSVSIGDGSSAEGDHSLALGAETFATAGFATALGNGSVASAQYTIAIGTDAEANAEDAMAIGRNTVASGLRAEAFGYNSQATADDAKAFGSGAQALSLRSVALGVDSVAGAVATSAFSESQDSIAIGTRARAAFTDPSLDISNDSIAIGRDSISLAFGTIALGADAFSEFEKAVIIGHSALEAEEWGGQIGSVAIGAEAQTISFSVAIGHRAKAWATDTNAATVVGTDSVAIGICNVVVGYDSVAQGNGCIAIGTHAEATGASSTPTNVVGGECDAIGSFAAVLQSDYAIALGPRANIVNANYSMALGPSAAVDHARSMAIGPSSQTNASNQIMFGSGNVFSDGTTLMLNAIHFNNSPAAGLLVNPDGSVVIAPSTATQVNANYSMLSTERGIYADASGGPITVTLPDLASIATGENLYVRKTDTSANTVTVVGNGGQTIGGGASVVLSTHNQLVHVRDNNSATNWLKII